jgi:hypothetical protein
MEKLTLSEFHIVSCGKAGKFQKMKQCIINAYFLHDKFSHVTCFVIADLLMSF